MKDEDIRMKKELFEETLTQEIINSKFYQSINKDKCIDKDVIGKLIDYAFEKFDSMIRKMNISTLYTLNFNYDLCSSNIYSISISCYFYEKCRFKYLAKVGEIINIISFSNLDDIEIYNPIAWSSEPIKDLRKIESYINIFDKVINDVLEKKHKEIS